MVMGAVALVAAPKATEAGAAVERVALPDQESTAMEAEAGRAQVVAGKEGAE